MTTTQAPTQQLNPPDKPWFDPKTGIPTKEFAAYMKQLDTAVRTLCSKI